jgi:hypothetical protein
MKRTLPSVAALYLASGVSLAWAQCNLPNFDFASFTNNADLGQAIPTDWRWAVGRTTGDDSSAEVVDTWVSHASNALMLRNTAETNRFLQIHQFFNQTDIENESVSTITTTTGGDTLVMYELDTRDVVTTGDLGQNAYIKLATYRSSPSRRSGL